MKDLTVNPDTKLCASTSRAVISSKFLYQGKNMRSAEPVGNVDLKLPHFFPFGYCQWFTMCRYDLTTNNVQFTNHLTCDMSEYT